jgi:serine/threonine protein kinase
VPFCASLKPENLLVANWATASLKVCDFGLSKEKEHRRTVVEQEGVFASAAYSAPELCLVGHSRKVDVYSFAVILWELLTSDEAWKEKKRSFMILEAVSAGQRPPLDDRIPHNDLRELIERNWGADVHARDEFVDIYMKLEAVERDLPEG